MANDLVRGIPHQSVIFSFVFFVRPDYFSRVSNLLSWTLGPKSYKSY